MKLNNRMIERAKPSGRVRRIRDGMGLYLEIRDGKRETHKHFVFRATMPDGKVSEIRLGKFPILTLAEAREQTIEIRRALRRGEDPRGGDDSAIAERKTTPSLRHCIKQAFAVREAAAKNGRGLVSRQRFIEQHAAHLLARPVDRIAPGDIAAALKPQWHRQSGRSMRNDLRGAFDWATAAGHFTGNNPAGDCLSALLPKGGLKREARKAVHYSEMPSILAAVKDADTETVNKLAWRFLALTACRPVEVLGAEWGEIDGDTWTIPASRMKMGRAHSVPLSAEALAVLAEAAKLGNPRFVFPSPRNPDAPVSVYGLHMVREALGIRDRMTNHGCRAVFKTWASEATQFAPDAVEQCLAHEVGNSVERVYNRGQMLERRREIMEAYCRFVTGDAAKVAKLRAV
ncbi:MAG: tyrosine-type recombinase/integrase [Gammaproteobacteria bacterium]|nr:tyrosine-type recombinase/integrase [Gammaproteobacteria bacterium]